MLALLPSSTHSSPQRPFAKQYRDIEGADFDSLEKRSGKPAQLSNQNAAQCADEGIVRLPTTPSGAAPAALTQRVTVTFVSP
jgi:hypothetical protein